MKRITGFSLMLVFIALMSVMGCNSAPKAGNVNDIGIVKPEPEPLGPSFEHMAFEDIVKGKVWYSKLKDDGNLEKVSQSVLRFNVSSKTFTKETYSWARYGRTNTYKYLGYNSQKGNYYYGEDGNNIEYELTGDYNVDASSSRKNNVLDNSKKSVVYSVKSLDSIIWNGEEFTEKQSLGKYFIGDFTNKREFILDF